MYVLYVLWLDSTLDRLTCRWNHPPRPVPWDLHSVDVGSALGILGYLAEGLSASTCPWLGRKWAICAAKKSLIQGLSPSHCRPVAGERCFIFCILCPDPFYSHDPVEGIITVPLNRAWSL